MERQTEIAKEANVMTTIDVTLVAKLVRDAGEWLLAEFPQIRPPVTREEMFAAFRAVNDVVEERLKTGLAAAYPAIPWSPEELELSADTAAPSGEIWICDAVDGAVQYLHHLPYWAIVLTLVRDGQPVFGLVHDAVHGELFHAVAGGGAFLNGAPIAAGKKARLEDALAVSTQAVFAGRDPVATRRAGASIAAMLPRIAALRNLGSYALQLAYVAAGRIDVYWQYGEDLSNWLAGSLLLREAGAAVSDAEGRPFAWGSKSLVATAPALHAQILEVLATVE